MWQLTIQQSYENFKTALPYGVQAPCINRQAFGVSQKKKKCEHEKQKQLLKTTISSKVSALRAPFFITHCIAKVNKPFNIGEELILRAATDICCELLGEAAVQSCQVFLFRLAP